MTLSDAAAPDPTLWSVTIVFVIAALVILPSIGLLYYLDQRDLLATPSADESFDAEPG
jgi:cytochrome bd-type quinol oxidase subunit 2